MTKFMRKPFFRTSSKATGKTRRLLSCLSGLSSFFMFLGSFALLCNPLFITNTLATIPDQQSIVQDVYSAWTESMYFESWPPESNCSDWMGVTCDSQGNVISIYFRGGTFENGIPPSISNLKELEYLDLSYNQLSIAIPSFIGNFTKLRHLDLSANELVGDIPPSIGNLKNLEYLNLQGNNLSGVILYSIGNLKNLEYLNLQGNNLSGVIPSAIGNLKNLEYLDLSFNNLTGSIPFSFGNLKNLRYLSLRYNQLSGAIPSSIGYLGELVELTLSGNQLSGVIPFSFSNLTNLRTLFLDDNQLSGVIPSTIGNITNDISIDLVDNYFIGISPSRNGSGIKFDLRSNCLKNVSLQKSNSECSSFCGANSSSGPCNGHGTCAINAQKKATCTCDAKWAPPNCLSQVKPPSSIPTFSPQSWRTSSLIPIPKILSTPHLNPYFRYASYKYTGTIDKPNWDLKASVNWKDDADMTLIEDQGTCNACWAMAPAASVESLLSISNVGLKILSKQQILDCQGQTKSCLGGWPTDAFEYMASHGVANNHDYSCPYRDQQCQDDGSFKYKNVKISMYEEVDYYGPFGLILAVQNQPVVVNIQSTSTVFQNYIGGILNNESCYTNVVDHTVVIIGYNLIGDPYWILRNSWGTSWGEEGYMRLAYTGGLGVCGIHSTPAYYPVLPFSVVASNNLDTENPCGRPDPCGGWEKCSIDPVKGKLNKCSSCPPSFVVVTNLDGTQSCAPKFVCRQKSSNPCGIGACVEDMKGGYSCICPPNSNLTMYSDGKGYTCLENGSSLTYGSPLVYTVQNGDSCSAIALTYGLSLEQLQKQNPKMNCAELIPGKSLLNVTQSSDWAGCAAKYSWNTGDTCMRISSLFILPLTELLSLNPALDCNAITQGTQICVKSGSPPVGIPRCRVYYPVSAKDSCASIIKQFGLQMFWFLIYNPGINCNSLMPTAIKDSNIKGPMVCVDSLNPYGSALKKCSKKSYTIQKFDTCAAILRKHYGNSIRVFKDKNFGFNCFNRKLKIGEPVCL